LIYAKTVLLFNLFDILVVDSVFCLLRHHEYDQAHDDVKDGHDTLGLHLIETDPIVIPHQLSLHHPVEVDERVTRLQQPSPLHVFKGVLSHVV
jgi:hypothetical protein